ncbi:MAG: signal recognition particle-docking protein FtsY [Chlamydiota bacterium]
MVLRFFRSGAGKVKQALSKSHSFLGKRLRSLVGKPLDEDTLEELEEILYEADLGVENAVNLVDKVRKILTDDPKLSIERVIKIIEQEIEKLLQEDADSSLAEAPEGEPTVIMVVGVNGSGKTTFIAKLAQKFLQQKKKVMLGAADTFRAAAIEQLEMWSQRLGVSLVKGQPKSDPAAVAYDTISAGKARGADVIIIDTAGRLHDKTHLMHELEKIKKSCQKVHAGAPHETLLVIDATTGQNAIDQAITFNKFTPLSGVVLNKLDGTAKGGIVVAIKQKLGIPIKFIGTGEAVEDLEPFDPQRFSQALFMD